MNPPLTIRLNPKEIFLRDGPRAERLRDLAANSEFQANLKDAFAEFCYNLPDGENPAQAWDANCKRTGAKQFIATLLALGDPPIPRTPLIAGRLERIQDPE